MAAAGLITLVNESLAGAEIPGDVIYDRVPPDSSPKIVDQAAGLYREHDCDCIVSVGGGSVIDTGKAVNIVVTEGVDSMAELKGVKLRKTLHPSIVIPTTSGTGSESTGVAVFDLTSLHLKTGISSKFLKPSLAVIDPDQTFRIERTT